MTAPTKVYDPEVAAYAEANGWVFERDNESGGSFGGLPVFVLWVSKPDILLAASWFGIRSQLDAERKLLPEMRAADADEPVRKLCVHLWMSEAPDTGLEVCVRACGARRRERIQPVQ